MKYLRFIVIAMFVIPCFLSCVAKYSIPEGSTIDTQFVGKWKGEHFNTDGDYWRKWTQTRNPDGTYKLVLDYYNKAGKYLESQTEKGYWWLKNGVFYEINPGRMSKPETYKYEFPHSNQIKFTSITLDASSDEKESYSFIDTRVE